MPIAPPDTSDPAEHMHPPPSVLPAAPPPSPVSVPATLPPEPPAPLPSPPAFAPPDVRLFPANTCLLLTPLPSHSISPTPAPAPAPSNLAAAISAGLDCWQLRTAAPRDAEACVPCSPARTGRDCIR